MTTNPMELIYSLTGYPAETEWIEFKEGNGDPQQIGKDISALANSAALLERPRAYKVWGVRDTDRALVGTRFNFRTKKGKGNQDLSIWLKTQLSPNADYEFTDFDDAGRHFVALEVRPASSHPVTFNGAAFIRVGSSTTALARGSARERELWIRLQNDDFETRDAMSDLTTSDLVGLLEINDYFDLLDLRRPSTIDTALIPLSEQHLIRREDNGRFAVTNLGAILLARRLSDFPSLLKRPVRVVRFAGDASFEILDDKSFDFGYARAIPTAEEFILSRLPAREVSEGAFRKVAHRYPRRAIRELLANAVIHQDLTNTHAGPRVDVFDSRIVFSNPGASLVPVPRMLNAQPRTRNVRLVRLLRQMDLCEEGGTGWDIIVDACERAHLRSPRTTSEEALGTTVTIFSHADYSKMSKTERHDAVYWHACLKFAQGESMSNQTLRDRFRLTPEQKNVVAISRLIRECCTDGIIKEEDPNVGPKSRRYVPAWA